jgi:multiple sugar transport system ATP-binding protein
VDSYRAYKDRPVIFGIRPEGIHDPNFIPPGITPSTVPATVTVTELMGNEVIVYLSPPEGREFVARVDRRSHVRIGESVNAIFDLDCFHLFDKQTEERLG